MRKVKAEGAGPIEVTPGDRRDVSFETRLGRLETIVRELENGERTLEDSLRLFEEGTELTRELAGTLDAAERKIELLVKDSSGVARLTPFQAEVK